MRELERNERASSNTDADAGAIERARSPAIQRNRIRYPRDDAEFFAHNREHFGEQPKSSPGQNISRRSPRAPRGSARRGNTPTACADFSARRARIRR
jgi:hypothetical protein